MSRIARPASVVSFDTSEALDLFDDSNASFRASKLAAAGALFGTTQRVPRATTDSPKRPTPTHPSRPLRRSTSEAIARPSAVATPSRIRSASAAHVQERPPSPDIDSILAKTPRPRRAASTVFTSSARPAGSLRSGRRSQSTYSLRSDAKERKPSGDDDESIFSISDYGALLEEDESQSDGEGGSESDSSLDIHTPLPHLMFRDGLLSPRSKLLPQDAKPALYPFGKGTDVRARSVMSIASTTGSFITKSGLQKDPRDTERRRQRHRDGALLRAGMGLTTGLGWSDSEDEDAPSALTRRLINTTLDRKRSASVALSSPSRPSSGYDDAGLNRFTSPAPTSRFTSPLPSPRPAIARKSSGSHVGARSLSVSQIQTRATTVSFPSTASTMEPKIPASLEEIFEMTESKLTSSIFATMKNKTSPTVTSAVPATNPARPRTASSASNSQLPVARSRADSSVSSTAGSRSRASSSASNAPYVGRRLMESSASAGSHDTPTMPRPSLESIASTSSSSIESSSSQISTSANSSSTASSGSVPRPLRLPQAVSARSQSQDHILSSLAASISATKTIPPPEGSSAPYQRTRTLSGPRPRPARSPTPTQSHPQPYTFSSMSPPPRTVNSPEPMESGSPIASSSSASSSSAYFSSMASPLSDDQTPTTSPSNSPPPSNPGSPRQRPTLIGARPKPRTGTGMAYRTSSFPNLQAQASALRMRTLATGPSAVSMAADGGYPVRI